MRLWEFNIAFKSPQNMMNFNMLFEFVQTSLDKNCTIADEVLKSANWHEVINTTSAHGLSAIAFDGLEKAVKCNPEYKNKIPKPLLLQLCGQAVHQTSLFKKNWSAACSLALLLSENGIDALVLKGYSIAQLYPIPEHRYSCDLDLYVAGTDWERACEILEAKGIMNMRSIRK